VVVRTAADIELVGSSEVGLIAVGRRVVQRHPVALVRGYPA
jgi:hypothetical protein